jgi:hypothetical protein
MSGFPARPAIRIEWWLPVWWAPAILIAVLITVLITVRVVTRFAGSRRLRR